MQEQNFSDLERRAAAIGGVDQVRSLEARVRVQDEIEKMRASGEALVLTEEEERMLWSFRRFRLRMRKHGEVFKWQTRRPEGVELVTDTALIVHPSEVEA